jgi:hypothetical protein
MWLRIDPFAIERFDLLRPERRTDGELRRYYCTARTDDRLALVVCRDDLQLPDLAGQLVDARIGWDRGYPGYVHVTSRVHSKVTIHRVLTFQHGAHAATLSDILRDAPRRAKE